MSDVALMNLAKKRIMLRNSFKWHRIIYGFAVIIIVIGCFIFDSGHFWPITILLAWGLAVALHGVSVNSALSDTRPHVADEYNRLKGFAMIVEKMNGGEASEKNN